MWNEALFTYFVAQQEAQLPKELPVRKSLGAYHIALSLKTECEFFCGKSSEIAVIGLCLPTSDDTPKWQELVDSIHTPEEFLAAEKYMAGRYVLLVHIFDAGYYLVGDATCSIQINYCTGARTVSSIVPLVVRDSNSKIDPLKQKVFQQKPISCAMPGDITVYEDIFALLPNHYLKLDSFQAVRFCASAYPINSGTVEDCCGKSLERARYICREMNKRFDIVCPVTGGRDSRVVLALLREVNRNLEAFTMRHHAMREDDQDLVVSAKLCKTIGQPHTVISDVSLLAEPVAYFDALFGVGKYNRNSVVLGETIKSRYEGKTVINGDIIGQIGKTSLHRDVPDRLMNAKYFQCKAHNFGATKYIKEWMADTETEPNVERCDLFSWEHRMGRWAAMTSQTKDLCGINELNFFNCREIISLWTSIPREIRKNGAIHDFFLGQIDPALKEIPYEKAPLVIRIGKLNWIAMYAATFAKFYYQKTQFNLRRK